MTDLHLCWFRSDLRCADNAALLEAARQARVVGVYCLCPEQWRRHDVGGPRADFVLRCLAALSEELDCLGIPLEVIKPETFEAVPAALVNVAQRTGASAIHFNAEYPLNERRRDDATESACREAGIRCHRHHDTVLQPPGSVLTGDGGPYLVFTPFRRRWLKQFSAAMAQPMGRPARQPRPSLETAPLPSLPEGFKSKVSAELWRGGEVEARRRLERFVNERVDDYARLRNFPAHETTSVLSAHLSVGAISPRECLARAMAVNDGRVDGGGEGASAWISEIIWREFYRHVVDAFPHVSRRCAFYRRYDAVRWRDDPEALAAWQAGHTGIPLVDAAMRQLNSVGWMHNRLRMVVAMFLSKNLLLDWRAGERYFMAQLVDGDFASNNGGWQWSASTGTDAAPYFRVFNPVTQSRRFDPRGRFLRCWVPELAGLSDRAIHEPGSAGRSLGYPAPIVDLKASRQRAIEAFGSL